MSEEESILPEPEDIKEINRKVVGKNSDFIGKAVKLEPASIAQIESEELEELKKPASSFISPSSSKDEGDIEVVKAPKKIYRSPLQEPKTKPIKTDKPIKPAKCKSASDCGDQEFCVKQTGTCVKRLELGSKGCLDHEHCLGKDGACVSLDKRNGNTCVQACNQTASKSPCGAEFSCMSAKGMLKGKSGQFNGICVDLMKDSSAGHKTSKAPTISVEKVAFNTLIGLAVCIFLITGLFYLRKLYIKRRRNADPKLFIFNSANNAQTDGDNRIDRRLLRLGGARYTRWGQLEAEY